MIPWKATAAFIARINRDDDRVLVLSMTEHEGRWSIIATHKDAASSTAVLDDHKHHDIGTFALERAFKEAKKYVYWWLLTSSKPIVFKRLKTNCGCADIGSSTKPKPTPPMRSVR